MTAGKPIHWPLRDALRTARAVLDGEMGIIEASIALSQYGHEVVPDWRIDPDFVIFGALASETDHLPFGEARALWSDTGLAKADAELELIAASGWREFSGVPSGPSPPATSSSW